MQGQCSGGTFSVGLVRKRVSSLNKEGEPVDNQDVGKGSDCRSLSPCNQKKISCLQDFTLLGTCLATTFRMSIFGTLRGVTGDFSEHNFSLNESP